MGAEFGGYYTFWILFIWALYLSPSNVCIGSADVYERECQGTSLGLTYTSEDYDIRYNNYRMLYENCTFVRDNIEIVYMEVSGAKYDFSFLDTIREVNGYVLIYGNHVDRIRLNGLRVIRGWNTHPTTVNNTDRNVSLLVGGNYHTSDNSIGLKELQLTSLVEITRGDVYFRANKILCFGERTIDWKSITQNNPNGEYFIKPSSNKKECNATCNKKCTIGARRFCWAGRRDMCQAERPCGNCSRNCSAIGCVCHSECIGGCTGSNASSCVACKNFLRGDECVGNCSEKMYNPDTSEWEEPPTTYMFGMRCVPECPESLVIQGESCVTACATGYKENKTSNKCVPCHEDCPKTCGGTGDTWLHGNNLAQFNQCTIVDGPFKILGASFDGGTVEEPKISVADLEILSDIQEITGQIKIQGSPSNFSSLSFLRNLRTIGGNGPKTWSLEISWTSLEALNLTSLKQIKTGGVLISNNDALCCAHTVNWTRILTSKKTNQRVIVQENANSTTCVEQGRTCSAKCAALGCWGPGDDNCVSSVN